MDSSLLEKYSEDIELRETLELLAEITKNSSFDSDPVIELHIRVAELLNTRREFLDGLGVLLHARGILQDRKDQLHPIMANVLAALGENYLNQGMYQESLPYFDKALSIKEALCISENIETALLFMKAGEILGLIGNVIASEDFFHRAYQIVEMVSPESSAIRSDISHNLGIVLLAKNEADRAKSFLLEAIELREKVFGIKSDEVSGSYLALSKVYFALSDKKSSDDSIKHAIAIKESLYGSDDEEVLQLKERFKDLYIVEETIFDSVATGTKISDPIVSQPIINKIDDAKILQAITLAALVALDQDNLKVAKEILKLSIQDSQNPASLKDIQRLLGL